MATISHNDRAPSDEAVTYSLAGAEPFTLTGSESYEVAVPDPEAEERRDYDTLVANAEAHPWLKVDRSDEAPDEADDDAVAVEFPKTAVDAALDQDTPEWEGKNDLIAETLAADEAQGDEPIVVDDPDIDDPVVPAEDKE